MSERLYMSDRMLDKTPSDRIPDKMAGRMHIGSQNICQINVRICARAHVRSNVRIYVRI